MFDAKLDKKQKIFFCTPVLKFWKTSTLNMWWGKTDLFKETLIQRDFKERYTTNFSSSRPDVNCEKVVLKNFATSFICISLKYSLSSEQQPV